GGVRESGSGAACAARVTANKPAEAAIAATTVRRRGKVPMGKNSCWIGHTFAAGVTGFAGNISDLLRGARGKVAGMRPDVVRAVVGLQIDGAEAAVGLEVGGEIDEQVLAAQLFFDGGEAIGNVFDTHGIKRHAAGRVRDLLQHVVALVATGADVGGDGVDDGLGALA